MGRVSKVYTAVVQWLYDRTLQEGTASRSPNGSADPASVAVRAPESPLQQARAESGERDHPSMPIASREVQGLSGGAGQRQPGEKEVKTSLPEGLGYANLLEMGIALGLPATALLPLAPHSSRSAFLYNLLKAACPLPLEQLAQALEAAALEAFPLAQEVRGMALRSPSLTAEDAQLLDLAQLLLPMEGEADALGELLGLQEATVEAIRDEFCPRPTQKDKDALVRQVYSVRSENQPSCQQWLDALAVSGAGWTAVKELAQAWDLELPAGHANWAAYVKHCKRPSAPVTALLAARQREPDGTPQLSKAWLLVRAHAHRYALSAAVDDPVDRSWGLPATGRSHLRGLLSFLHGAARQPTDELDWAFVDRLAYSGCMEPEAAAQLQRQGPMPETASRPLRLSDLTRLIGVARPEKEAMEVACLLGVKQSFSQLKEEFPNLQEADRALHIWRQIFETIPGLETGHLVQLFRELGQEPLNMDKDRLIECLTGDRNSTLMPDVPLRQLFATAANTLELAKDISIEATDLAIVEKIRGFFDSPFHGVPKDTAPLCQLLNLVAHQPEAVEIVRLRFPTVAFPPFAPAAALRRK